MDAKRLPARPNLEQYRSLAKELVKASNSGGSSSVSRLNASLKAASKPSPRKLSLPDAQLFVAREYGFASWKKFSEHITALASNDPLASAFELEVKAIITGDPRSLRSLLRLHPELIRARSPRMHRAALLHYTAANGVENFLQKTPKNIVRITEFLLKAGADVDATADMYGGGATTLGLAVTSVHPFLAGVQNDLVDVLLKYGADINHPQGAGNGQPPINGCFANGRLEAAEHLAKRGARLDLEAAAGVGRLDVVRQFFTPKGNLIRSTDAQLKSGFKWACAYGRIEIVRFLLKRRMDVGEIYRGETPLHWAAYGAHTEIVRLLLKHKVRHDIKDESFKGTPLGWAVYGWGESTNKEKRERYYQIVKVLVASGASIDPAWLNEKDRGMPLDAMTANDGRMARALRLHPLDPRRI